MTVIIDIDLEDGTANELTSVTGLVTVTQASALAGTAYGLAVNTTGSAAAYVTKNLDITDTSGEFRGRYYFDPNSLTMAEGNVFFCLDGRNGAFDTILGGRLFYSGGAYNLSVYGFNDAGGTFATNFYTLTDAPHYIEIYLIRAANDTSSDGSIELFIDGVSQQAVTGADNYDRFNNFISFRMGAVSGLDAGTSGTFYLDELVINNDGSEIGAYVPPVPPVDASFSLLGVASMSVRSGASMQSRGTYQAKDRN